MKLPVVYVYKRTSDKGKELRYSMRTLSNLKNWNGEVYVAGDREDWFSPNVKVIDGFIRSHEKHIDQENKLKKITEDNRFDSFIYFNDDFYVTEPTEIKPLYDGRLVEYQGSNGWQRAKADTKKYLEEMGMKEPKNYDIHVPMVLESEKLAVVLAMIREQKKRLQPRSIYGNMYGIGGKQYKDRKTQTHRLLDGNLLSTRVFTNELARLYPMKSEFEK